MPRVEQRVGQREVRPAELFPLLVGQGVPVRERGRVALHHDQELHGSVLHQVVDIVSPGCRNRPARSRHRGEGARRGCPRRGGRHGRRSSDPRAWSPSAPPRCAPVTPRPSAARTHPDAVVFNLAPPLVQPPDDARDVAKTAGVVRREGRQCLVRGARPGGHRRRRPRAVHEPGEHGRTAGRPAAVHPLVPLDARPAPPRRAMADRARAHVDPVPHGRLAPGRRRPAA